MSESIKYVHEELVGEEEEWEGVVLDKVDA